MSCGPNLEVTPPFATSRRANLESPTSPRVMGIAMHNYLHRYRTTADDTGQEH
jgi:hypothetical protein